MVIHMDDLKDRIRNWWNTNPFTYFVNPGDDWVFFREVDRKAFKWHTPWAHTHYPLLSNLIDYSKVRGKKVLDLAVGADWSTEQFARMGAEVTAIDLTRQAVALTKRRFELYGLRADIREADAEHLPFPDASFDFVLAWGCLMHTPDTQGAINEIHRVLKPGGTAWAMMYNRNSSHWKWNIYFLKGILGLGRLRHTGQGLANRYTDGVDRGGNVLTKFFSPKQLRVMWGQFSRVDVRVYGLRETIDDLPHRFLPLGSLLP